VRQAGGHVQLGGGDVDDLQIGRQRLAGVGQDSSRPARTLSPVLRGMFTERQRRRQPRHVHRGPRGRVVAGLHQPSRTPCSSH
jgi:hypothetical protein